MTVVCLESSFRFLFGAHSNLVITCAEIKPGEELGTCQFVEQLIHNWKGKFVFDCKQIQPAIIDAKPLGSILLFD
jgi:hypothetical protein